MGASLRPDMIQSQGPCGAVAAALLVDTYSAIDAFERSGDEQAYQDVLMVAVTKGTRLFMGIPTEAGLAGT